MAETTPVIVEVNAQKTDDTPIVLRYHDILLVDSGAFGSVFRVTLLGDGLCAIKKVQQDRRFKNRELQMMKRMQHPNVIRLLYYFYSEDDKNSNFLCLVMDYLKTTVYRELRAYRKRKETLPLIFIKLWMYQLLRGLAFVHSLDVVHRDVKPQNLLLKPEDGELKLCDFGTAKEIVAGEASTPYVCSRYYRAPELIFGAKNYTVAVDTWSAGCVMGELFLGKPLFPGKNSVDQLVQIIRLLGTPSAEKIHDMNSEYPSCAFPSIKPTPWDQTLPASAPAAASDLIGLLLSFGPGERPSCMSALTHPFFDELRLSSTCMPDGAPLPPLFNWIAAETARNPPALLQRIAGLSPAP